MIHNPHMWKMVKTSSSVVQAWLVRASSTETCCEVLVNHSPHFFGADPNQTPWWKSQLGASKCRMPSAPSPNYHFNGFIPNGWIPHYFPLKSSSNPTTFSRIALFNGSNRVFVLPMGPKLRGAVSHHCWAVQDQNRAAGPTLGMQRQLDGPHWWTKHADHVG